jgi:hypothetical protein
MLLWIQEMGERTLRGNWQSLVTVLLVIGKMELSSHWWPEVFLLRSILGRSLLLL